jgi:hypothetical protein
MNPKDDVCWLTVDCVKLSRSAARWKPPQSATATKARNSSKSSKILIQLHDQSDYKISFLRSTATAYFCVAKRVKERRTDMLTFDRRMLLRAGSAAVGAAALAPTVPALAHAPQAAKPTQPSFYRFKLGAI